jgi:regulator of sigma E protease
MPTIIGTSAGQTLQVEVDRGGHVVSLTAIPALKEIKDDFGNVHRIGVLGITRSMAPGDM